MQKHTLMSACSSWHNQTVKQRRLRASLRQAVLRLSQQGVVKCFGTWGRVCEESRALLMEHTEMAMELLRDRTQTQALNAWCIAIFEIGHSGEMREKWRRLVWRHMGFTALAQHHTSMLRDAAALKIQAHIRGQRGRLRVHKRLLEVRSRHAATVLQAGIRTWLCMRAYMTRLAEVVRLPKQQQEEEKEEEKEEETGTAVAGSEEVPQSEEAARERALARTRRAQAAAAAAAAVAAKTQVTDAPVVVVDEERQQQLHALKQKFSDLRAMLAQMQRSNRLFVYDPTTRARGAASVWVDLELKQLKWETFSEASVVDGSNNRVCREQTWPFDQLQRVCWGASASAVEGTEEAATSIHKSDRRINALTDTPALCFSVGCVNGGWLDFAVTNGSTLRTWLLGLQALVTKPGEPLMVAAKLDWLLQQATGEACAVEPNSSAEPLSRLPESPQADDKQQGSSSTVALAFNITECLKELFDAALPAGDTHSQLAKVSTLLVGLNSELQSRGLRRSFEDTRALRRVQRGLAGVNHNQISYVLCPRLSGRLANPSPGN